VGPPQSSLVALEDEVLGIAAGGAHLAEGISLMLGIPLPRLIGEQAHQCFDDRIDEGSEIDSAPRAARDHWAWAEDMEALVRSKLVEQAPGVGDLLLADR